MPPCIVKVLFVYQACCGNFWYPQVAVNPVSLPINFIGMACPKHLSGRDSQTDKRLRYSSGLPVIPLVVPGSVSPRVNDKREGLWPGA